MSDIVERLRLCATLDWHPHNSAVEEAADEIKRLRAERNAASRACATAVDALIVAERQHDITIARAEAAEKDAALLSGIRADGWTVAVHNDYRLNGESFTFWLFVKGQRAVKGEARTDAEALTIVRAAIDAAMEGGK